MNHPWRNLLQLPEKLPADLQSLMIDVLKKYQQSQAKEAMTLGFSWCKMLSFGLSLEPPVKKYISSNVYHANPI